MRIFLGHIDLDALHGHAHAGVPRDEAQIRVGAFVADQVLFPVEPVVEHHGDAFDLVLVALDGGGELFGVVFDEPDGLPEVGALPGHLEKEPLFGVEFLGRGVVGEFVGLVVLFD